MLAGARMEAMVKAAGVHTRETWVSDHAAAVERFFQNNQ